MRQESHVSHHSPPHPLLSSGLFLPLESLPPARSPEVGSGSLLGRVLGSLESDTPFPSPRSHHLIPRDPEPCSTPPWASFPDQSPSWDPKGGGPEQRPESGMRQGGVSFQEPSTQGLPGLFTSTTLKNLPSPSLLCSSHGSAGLFPS